MTDGVSRPRGRPRLDPGDTTSKLTIPLPAALHDQLCVCALNDGVTVNHLARQAIEREVSARLASNKALTKHAVTRPGRY
jgi:arginine deiminase